jgi:anti-sigma regulatory factor (Ser/Thr protein kinase)
MVALLWDSGDVANAIAVESLWNDLALEIPFSLLCTYPHDSVSSSEHIEALHTICRLHSAVFEPLERPTRFASAEFALDLTSPRMAHQFATQWLRRWGHGEALVEDATLLLSEVAANAVIHAHSPFAVEIHDTDDSARIAVRDHSTEVPATTRCPDMNSASGRGLQLVARIAHRWGVDPSIDGKTVWFELLR